MKKFFVLFLALTFVLSMGTFVFADDGGAIVSMKAGSTVTIGGDARVRGIYSRNYMANLATNGTAGNFNDSGSTGTNDSDVRYYDQRVRLKITATVGNGIEMRSRLTSGTDQWDGTTTTNTSGTIGVDYMYLHIPVSGLVIDVGNMHRNWGNKLLIWDSGRDTFQITTNIGSTQLGLYTDKVDDSSSVTNALAANTGAENLEDFDNYGIFVNHTAGNLAVGLHIIREDDNRAVTDTSGTEVSAYLNTSVGAIGIAAEIASKSGDITGNKDALGNTAQAGFISVSTDVGAVGVSLSFFLSKNAFTADSHFTPTIFFGIDQPTAISNVTSAANSTTKGYIIGASTDISSDLSVSAKLAYFDLENLGTALGGTTTGKEDATEIDLGLTYKLADNATYKVDFGYFMPDNITTRDDEAIALAHKIEVSF